MKDTDYSREDVYRMTKTDYNHDKDKSKFQARLKKIIENLKINYSEILSEDNDFNNRKYSYHEAVILSILLRVNNNPFLLTEQALNYGDKKQKNINKVTLEERVNYLTQLRKSIAENDDKKDSVFIGYLLHTSQIVNNIDMDIADLNDFKIVLNNFLNNMSNVDSNVRHQMYNILTRQVSMLNTTLSKQYIKYATNDLRIKEPTNDQINEIWKEQTRQLNDKKIANNEEGYTAERTLFDLLNKRISQQKVNNEVLINKMYMAFYCIDRLNELDDYITSKRTDTKELFKKEKLLTNIRKDPVLKCMIKIIEILKRQLDLGKLTPLGLDKLFKESDGKDLNALLSKLPNIYHFYCKEEFEKSKRFSDFLLERKILDNVEGEKTVDLVLRLIYKFSKYDVTGLVKNEHESNKNNVYDETTISMVGFDFKESLFIFILEIFKRKDPGKEEVEYNIPEIKQHLSVLQSFSEDKIMYDPTAKFGLMMQLASLTQQLLR